MFEALEGIFAVATILICAIGGYYLAKERNRSKTFWTVFCAITAPFGILTLVFMDEVSKVD